MNQKKKGAVAVTLLSALLFCLLPVLVSLSPLAETGPNANRFNSAGMWAAVGQIFVIYAVPLILYILGIRVMKIIMAVFCGIGLIICAAVLLVALLTAISLEQELFLYYGLFVWSGAAFIVNVVWYIAAFRSSPKHQQAM
ncbi:DUF5391 family protein [Bacillus velezensis]|uniref:DUF5391 family protein n=1 Tax=Bacillus amyloliquefaciens group TaxID=1938374 RepID=UPI00146B9B80|nr:MULTISPECIES: DUF5391 family protein [Bacillus amyloliquefaciens group]MCM3105160.1 DUF5391 domain-containing protein [Bacillus velezensis]MCR4372705.1 DUF5391 domain-containing protein [Bacillus amyloliquefaciens]MDQ9148255.1 DUF5391 family protein [Bacillus velezensis]MEC2185591.1 DUF5391 family protein [Bacillus velezensis]MED3449833.1 DUF5391 family protein [Bacillus velezensis]